MKKKINLNYYFSQVFVKQLKRLGVKDVCISPGSRNTPLTMAFANERGIKKHIIIDERSSAFFALGIAKAKGIPAAILTTSGTATAELYPAIIEAYNSRIPLIAITADRPPELIDTGANQTIHQANMYANHIRLFVDAGLPKINKLALKRIQQKATDLFLSASVKNRGPVHINFPFRKPLEPFSFNAELEKDVYDYFLKNDASGKSLKLKRGEIKPSLVKKIKNAERPLILAGLDNYDDDFAEQVINLSYKMNAPIIADIYSNLRFGNNCENIISQAGNFLRSKEIDKKFEPDIIIQFGNAPTVNSLLEFFKNVDAYKIGVNEYGELKDPSRTTNKLLNYSPAKFCSEIARSIDESKNNDWLNLWIEKEKETGKILSANIDSKDLSFEPVIHKTLISNIKAGSIVFISNSMPARDTDFFAGKGTKKLTFFSNRGASGIDGIISTTAGTASALKKRVYLVIGDLAFFHDSNGLWLLKEYKIPLTIILVNNSGGGIFRLLPISQEEKHFEEFFTTDPGITPEKFAQLYYLHYYLAKDTVEFVKILKAKKNPEDSEIIEIRTDSKSSVEGRIKIWNEIKKSFGN